MTDATSLITSTKTELLNVYPLNFYKPSADRQ